MTEGALLRWLRRQEPALAELLGNDAAVLPSLKTPAVTVDSQIEGVHFPPGTDPGLVAQRLLAVNLSDLAAMGARPRFGFLTLSVPKNFPHRRFFRSFLKACRQFDVQLAGGDLASCPQITASLTLLGERPPGGRWLERSAGKPGHTLWAGGSLGESALGRYLLAAGAQWQGNRISLPPEFPSSRPQAIAARKAVRRHLRPTPQLELGYWLGRQPSGAVLDVSDGLSIDLHRLCEASGAGAEIIASDLPAPPQMSALCQFLEQAPTSLILGGGEDYVLLFSLPPETVPPPIFSCHPIGKLTREASIRLLTDGRSLSLSAEGWDHLSPTCS